MEKQVREKALVQKKSKLFYGKYKKLGLILFLKIKMNLIK